MNVSVWNKGVPILFIVVFACFSWGGQYTFRHLWEPDEARYTYVAKEMKETNNFWVPQRNGEYYAHKPPLIFLLINAGTLFTR